MIYPDFLTPRLRAEALRADHSPVIWERLQDERLYTFSAAEPLSIEALHRRYNFLETAISPDGTEPWMNWVLFLRETNEAVGVVQATVILSRSATIGYEILSHQWRKGIGAESVKAMIETLFGSLRVSVILAEIDGRNQASVALAEAVGMTRVGRLNNNETLDGEVIDEYRYELFCNSKSYIDLLGDGDT